MEKRLKKQRNRLLLRVTLILLAVWLAVSATYCVIRLHTEKTDMQNRVLSDLSQAKHIFSLRDWGLSTESSIYLSDTNLISFKDILGKDFDSQLIVIDPDSNEVIADTADKIVVTFSLKTDAGSYPDDYGTINYNAFRSSISDSQYERIVELLSTVRSDGRSYELVCTRFYISWDEIIPLELSVMLVEHTDDWFEPENIVETFALNGRTDATSTVYYNARSRMNMIPKGFVLHNEYNQNYISQLTEEQRKKNSEVIPVGTGEYLFYTSEYYFLDAFVYNEEKNDYENIPKLYLVQYLKKANILESCSSDLLLGIGAIFGFFFTIGTIIYLMIWNTVRTQILQEQKRLDLTNALAHDIKTPLFVISGYAYSLKEDIDSDERDSYLDKIIGQTEQINGLVHKMLNLSKLDSYNMTLNRTEFELYGLINDILEDYKSLPDSKTISLTHTGEGVISADKELIRTAMQNLIENAVKYSPPGSEIIVNVAGNTVSISNPSQPLTKAELKKIWQPYFRMDNSRHKKGNGLGLSIVKSILDLHGVKYDMSMKDGRMVFAAEF